GAEADGWSVDTAVNVDPASNTWALRTDPATSSATVSYNTDAIASDAVNSADTTKDVRLVSPSFLVSGQTELSFQHRFFTEIDFDGGVLEVSTDDGTTWRDIETAGGSITQGGYTGTLSAGSGFALSGRRAWTGQNDAYPNMEEVKVDLSVFASQNIRLRFRLGQDVLLGVGAPFVGGWFVDDVSLNNLYESCEEGVPGPQAADDSDSVAAGGTVTTDVRLNDTDNNPDTGDLFVSAIVTLPQHGTASIVDDGPAGDVGNYSVKYSHNGGIATSDYYEYRIEDPDGQFDVARVNIVITQPANEKPVANDDTGTVVAGESTTIDVKLNDNDDQGAANLTVTIESSPQSGFAGVNGDGTVTYTHNGDSATSDSFQYRVTDQFGEFDVATVTITIEQDNTGATCRNDLCAAEDSDKPAELTMTYTGGTCSDSANTQGSKADCVDHVPGGASGTVVIRATNKEDDDADSAKVYYEGTVSEGADFTISAANAGEVDLGSKTFIHIYALNGTLLQTIELHTSCSAPLIEGERFGSLMLGDAETNAEDPICTAGEGRVHGSGYWDTDDDMDSDSDSDKIDFSFDAKVYKGGYKGKLKINDKYMDLKIDAKTITSLSTGNGELCDGDAMDDNPNSFLFTAVGKFELGDDEVDDAEFRACGADNGKNKHAPYDSFFVECVANCIIPYSTANGSNDIDGGNIHLHDAITDPVSNEPAASQASAPAANEPTAGDSAAPTEPGSAPANEPAAGSSNEPAADTYDPAAEPEGSPDVITLEPMLLTTAPTGTPMVVTAIAEVHGGATEGTPVTLHWTTADGIKGQTTSLANAFGIAAFVVTVPAGDVVYSAKVGDLKSNSMRVNGF
ncbi:MAG: Ig-like domain-containing protein, partial [Woeseia sp.]